jgi:hypothetical protein
VDDDTLGRIDEALNAHEYRTHEFGDSLFLECMPSRYTQFRRCAG